MRLSFHPILLLVLGLLLLSLPGASGWYNVTSERQESYGWELTLQKVSPGPYPSSPDIASLAVSVYYETAYRLRIIIRDATTARWEVPAYLRATSLDPPSSDYASARSDFATLYVFTKPPRGDGFGFIVRRASTNAILFNTDEYAEQFVYSERYIQLTSALPVDHALFGLGERATSLRVPHGVYTMWNADNYTQYAEEGRLNMYGSHPAYWQLERGTREDDEASGSAHAVVLYNSNQMDIVVANDTITYRVTGGIIDLSILLGPTPADVASQYTELVGRPHLPPMWALGWHTCRWGIPSVAYARDMVEAYRAGGFPLDVVWHDIDYMSYYFDFTFDTQRFAAADLAAFNQYLAASHLRHVYIVDPGIPALLTLPGSTAPYLPYVQGSAGELFIRHPANDSFLYACVWPSVPVVFPDFSRAETVDWWRQQIEQWTGGVGLPDGLWLDMNELSSFVNGELPPDGCLNHTYAGPAWSTITLTNVSTQVDPKATAHPRVSSPTDIPALPYVPGGLDGSTKTINVSAHLQLSQFFNVHNLFGQLEQRATRLALQQLRAQNGSQPLRAFTLSRATFLGSGSQGSSWTGDHDGGWKDLRQQVVMIQQMGLHGVTMVGSDLCGLGALDEVNGDGGAEVCTRWLQAGALFPFARLHYQDFNTSHHREPYAWPEPARSMQRQALLLRYSLLTYLNTLTIDANLTGAPLWRPLWFDFARDNRTWTVEQQAMVGPALMAAPVTQGGAQQVEAYLPNATWYDFATHRRVERHADTGRAVLSGGYAVNATIPLLMRGGYILTTQPPQLTTADTYTQPLTVVAALDADGSAAGYVYLDDGVSLNSVDAGLYQTLRFTAEFNVSSGRGMFNVTGHADIDGAYDVSSLYVDSIVLLGYTASAPLNLTLGGGDLGPYCLALNYTTAVTRTEHSLTVRLPSRRMLLTHDWTLSFNDGCVVPAPASEALSLAVPIVVLCFLVVAILVALVYTRLTRRKQQLLSEQQRLHARSRTGARVTDLVSPSVGAASDPSAYKTTATGKVKRKKRRVKPVSRADAGMHESLMESGDTLPE